VGRRRAPPLIIAVNVSVSEFHERGFVANLMQAIQDNGVEPARLELELTESAAVQNVEGTTRSSTGFTKSASA